MISKVSDNTKFSFLADHFSRLQDQIQDTTNHISSGNRIDRAADDPEGTRLVLSMTGQTAAISAYRENVSLAKTWVQSTSTTLKAVGDFIGQAQELAQGSLTVSTGERANLVQRIQDISDQVLSLANSRINGRYLFSGSLVNSAPFTADGGAPGKSSYSYNGNDISMLINVGQGCTGGYNLPGDSVFKGTDGGVDVFQALGDLKTALQQDDGTAIASAIKKLGDAAGQINKGIEKTSLMLSDLSMADNRLVDRQTLVTTQMEKIQNADIPELAVDYNLQSVALSASYETARRISELSLLNFLK